MIIMDWVETGCKFSRSFFEKMKRFSPTAGVDQDPHDPGMGTRVNDSTQSLNRPMRACKEKIYL